MKAINQRLATTPGTNVLRSAFHQGRCSQLRELVSRRGKTEWKRERERERIRRRCTRDEKGEACASRLPYIVGRRGEKALNTNRTNDRDRRSNKHPAERRKTVDVRMMETTATMADDDDDDEPLLSVPADNGSSHPQRCPTCQGTGVVAQSSGLVALIPLDDVRLKRRHTFLWIILTIIFCALAASATIAVLLPRSVHLSIKNPLVIDATNGTFRNSTCFRLKFSHHTAIQSDNWVPIRLINLTASVEHQLVPVGPDAEKSYGHKMLLRPLGTIESNMSVPLDFDTDTMAYRVCHGIFRQMLLFKVRTTLTYADFLLGRIQTANDISYQYVLCNRGDWTPEELLTMNTTVHT